jgi:hypothetical protein
MQYYQKEKELNILQVIKTIIMKTAFTFLLILVATCISCNNTAEKITEPTVVKDSMQPVENKIMIPKSSCYSTINSKDTVRLKVEVFEKAVTGNILYKLYEKDSNSGNFEGQLKGDTLLADYTFMSEGKQSVRQVIYLLQDSIAIEGYGDMKDKNGKMIFINTNAVSFDKGLRLQKSACDK